MSFRHVYRFPTAETFQEGAMLHDLYLLTCYFEPTNAILYEDELERRYGINAVNEAVRNGYIELFRAPCIKGTGKCFYRLSARGLVEIEKAIA